MAGGVNAGADRNPQTCRASDIRALRIVRTAASRRSDARTSPVRWALLSQATARKAGNQSARFASVCEMGRSQEEDALTQLKAYRRPVRFVLLTAVICLLVFGSTVAVLTWLL